MGRSTRGLRSLLYWVQIIAHFCLIALNSTITATDSIWLQLKWEETHGYRHPATMPPYHPSLITRCIKRSPAKWNTDNIAKMTIGQNWADHPLLRSSLFSPDLPLQWSPQITDPISAGAPALRSINYKLLLKERYQHLMKWYHYWGEFRNCR